MWWRQQQARIGLGRFDCKLRNMRQTHVRRVLSHASSIAFQKPRFLPFFSFGDQHVEDKDDVDAASLPRILPSLKALAQ